MTIVTELNKDELNELRERLFYQMQDDGSMIEIMQKQIYDSDEIPNSLLFSHYQDTFFVDDDFFCNISE